MANKVIKRFLDDITITTAGVELDILGNNYQNSQISGYIQQIVFELKSGSATQLSSIQIRYEAGNSGASNLLYSAGSSTLTSGAFTDSYIAAPFSLMSPDPFQDIILFVTSDATGVFKIRVDLEIYV